MLEQWKGKRKGMRMFANDQVIYANGKYENKALKEYDQWRLIINIDKTKCIECIERLAEDILCMNYNYIGVTFHRK